MALGCTILLWTLACCCFTGCSGQIAVTQPPVQTFTPGSTVTLTCQISSNVYRDGNGDWLHWYQHKPGQSPKLWIYLANRRWAGTPSRFNGGGAFSDFSLTITGVQAEDAAVYHCQSYHVISSTDVYTFGGGTQLIVDLGVQRPTLTVLPPSREELQSDSVTLLCLADGGFPSDWTLGWKVGGVSTAGSQSQGVLRGDGHYSRTSVLRLSTEKWTHTAVSCEASRSGQSPVTQRLETLCPE